MKTFNLRTLVKTSLSTLGLFLTSVQVVSAQQVPQGGITNPGVGPILGGSPVAANSGATFAYYFITLWRGVITVGTILLLIYFLWGAIEWISAGGDGGKVTKARDRLTQSLVGFIILVSSAVILAFLGRLFFGDNLNLFQINLPSTIQQGGQNQQPVTLPGGISVP